MKKQKIRFYAALLCSSMVFSLVSTPVSAAETGQLTNPQTSTEGPGSPESTSGNEAAAVLNGLYVALPVANGEAEVTTAEELTAALANSSISGITLKGEVEISSTLTVNRTVTLDLNGNVLKMTGGFSVIKVESGGDLTIADSTPNKVHKFNPNYTDMWGCGLWKLDKDTGTEIVSGGVITGGGGNFAHSDGGGVLVNVGGNPQFVQVGLRLGFDRDTDHRLGEGHLLQDDRCVLGAERVARADLLETDGGADVARNDRLDRVLLVGVHLEQTRYTLFLSRTRIENIRSGRNLSRIHTEETQTTYIRIDSEPTFSLRREAYALLLSRDHRDYGQ